MHRGRCAGDQAISIHALREEGDLFCVGSTMPPYLFLSTPSARRATRFFCRAGYFDLRFLSTPSARRATKPKPQQHVEQVYFYPRPPRGGRQMPSQMFSFASSFLSTPSARRATLMAGLSTFWSLFLSTPSARRATVFGKKFYRTLPYFYPRPPRGGRQLRSATLSSRSVFLSTPSARRATLSLFFV